MITKVLIANRGEIAVRVARSCRELGVPVALACSAADVDSLAARMVDETVVIGPGPAKASYLNIPAMIEACRRVGADAVHPGYGFLAENPDFAQVCRATGITFIGPPPEVMARFGDKVQARALMSAAGVPLLPGSNGPLIGPAMFRKWMTPAYERLIAPCRERGILVSLHSDGNIMPLMDEFQFAGVNIINPQDLCNGIDNLVSEVKGRACINLDIDRQTVVPFGTPEAIHDLIEEEVRKLGSLRGGLSMVCGIYPPTPPENVEAVCSALEEFRTYWFDGRGK